MIIKETNFIEGEVNSISYKKMNLEELAKTIRVLEKTYNDTLAQSKYEQYDVVYLENRVIVYAIETKEEKLILEVVSLKDDLIKE